MDNISSDLIKSTKELVERNEIVQILSEYVHKIRVLYSIPGRTDSVATVSLIDNMEGIYCTSAHVFNDLFFRDHKEGYVVASIEIGSEWKDVNVSTLKVFRKDDLAYFKIDQFVSYKNIYKDFNITFAAPDYLDKTFSLGFVQSKLLFNDKNASNEIKLICSTGSVIDLDNKLRKDKDRIDTIVYESSSITFKGMSGGIVFNEEGFILGIQSHVWAEKPNNQCLCQYYVQGSIVLGNLNIYKSLKN